MTPAVWAGVIAVLVGLSVGVYFLLKKLGGGHSGSPSRPTPPAQDWKAFPGKAWGTETVWTCAPKATTQKACAQACYDQKATGANWFPKADCKCHCVTPDRRDIAQQNCWNSDAEATALVSSEPPVSEQACKADLVACYGRTVSPDFLKDGPKGLSAHACLETCLSTESAPGAVVNAIGSNVACQCVKTAWEPRERATFAGCFVAAKDQDGDDGGLLLVPPDSCAKNGLCAPTGTESCEIAEDCGDVSTDACGGAAAATRFQNTDKGSCACRCDFPWMSLQPASFQVAGRNLSCAGGCEGCPAVVETDSQGHTQYLCPDHCPNPVCTGPFQGNFCSNGGKDAKCCSDGDCTGSLKCNGHQCQ